MGLRVCPTVSGSPRRPLTGTHASVRLVVVMMGFRLLVLVLVLQLLLLVLQLLLLLVLSDCVRLGGS